MRIEIISKSYKKGEKLDGIIKDKLSKLDRYFEDEANVKVSLKQIGKEGTKTVKYGMEITIFYGSNFVRSEVISDNMYKNIDLALPKLEGQIRKYKTRLDKLKKEAFDESALYASTIPEEKQLVRTKTIHLNSISTKEAIEKMAMTDHDFYVYMDEASGMVSIVYNREDGEVGRIELVY